MNDLKIGPCAVIYQDEFLGVCDDGLQFRGESVSQAATSQQSYAQAVDRTLTALNPTVTAEVVHTVRAMRLLFGDAGLGLHHLGCRFSKRAAELKLIPLNPHDDTGYLIPCAVPDRSFQYQFKSSAPHAVRITFNILPDADGQLVRAISAADSRALIPQPPATDIIALEKSLAAHLAALLGLTLDQDIFCGRIPSEKYGVVVAVEGKSRTGSAHEFDQYRAYVEFCHRHRPEVLAAMNLLAGMLPLYGLDFAQAIRDEGQSYPAPAAEDSNSFYRGKITLSVIV